MRKSGETILKKEVPSHISAGFLRIPVEIWNPKQRRCHRCYTYGHTDTQSRPCRRRERCLRCGGNAVESRHPLMRVQYLSDSWQKLDAVRTFIVPRLTHYLRLGLLPKAPLRDLDAALRWRVKGLLNLPNSATCGYLYGLTSAGCVGLTCLADETNILMVSASAQLLRPRDPRVAELRVVVRRRTEGQSALTSEQLAGYLNSDRLRDGGDVFSRFTMDHKQITNIFANHYHEIASGLHPA